MLPPGNVKPATPGVGEVWVDTQFEKTAGKTKPGTATAVDVENWKVSKKVGAARDQHEQPAQHVDRQGPEAHLPNRVVQRQPRRVRPGDAGSSSARSTSATRPRT